MVNRIFRFLRQPTDGLQRTLLNSICLVTKSVTPASAWTIASNQAIVSVSSSFTAIRICALMT